MNYLNCIVLLCLLAGFSFLINVFVLFLDLCGVLTKQKLSVLKIGYVTILIVAMIFSITHAFALKPLIFYIPNTVVNQIVITNKSVPISDFNFQWSKIICVLYEIGCLIMISRIIASYILAKIKVKNSILANIQGVQVFLNRNIESPFSFGFPIAKIYLPEDAEKKWVSREIEMILFHEKNHVSQYDCIWKLFSLIVKSLLFFAPWSYTLHHRFELEMEIYCDEKTRVQTRSNIKEYSTLLIKIMCDRNKNFVFSNLTDSTLKRRLLAMKSMTKNKLILTVILTFLLMMCGIAIASTNVVNTKNLLDITSKIFIDGKLVTSPHIITYPNQKAQITISNKNEKNGIRMSLIANDIESSIKKSIDINYDIDYKDSDIHFKTKQEIFVIPNQAVKVRIFSYEGHVVDLSVLVKKTKTV